MTFFTSVKATGMLEVAHSSTTGVLALSLSLSLSLSLMIVPSSQVLQVTFRYCCWTISFSSIFLVFYPAGNCLFIFAVQEYFEKCIVSWIATMSLCIFCVLCTSLSCMQVTGSVRVLSGIY